VGNIGILFQIITSKVTFNLFKKFNNGTNDTTEAMTGRNYLKVKTTYNGVDVWWGLETNENGTVKFPIQNNTNISVRIFANDAPPREIEYKNIVQSEINITLETMDQMVDDKGQKLDGVQPSFYRSNSTCDKPDASGSCVLLSFNNASEFNPFQLFTLGGDISVRLTLPSGVVLHYLNVDILAGEPDAHKPSQSANTTTGGAVTEAWKFGSMIPREMYESVLVGVPYNTSLVSEDHSFKLLITELFDINASGDWVQSWNSTADPNANSVPSYYQDFSDHPDIFNVTLGGISCSKTNTSANCYVDITNDLVWFKIDHFSGLGPQVQSYANLGNISSDEQAYSCWPDACTAFVNLTVSSDSPLANKVFNVTLNNTAQASGINYGIDWWNSTAWVNQTANNTLIDGGDYNLTVGTHRFRINITLPSAISTKWNVSFNINGTDYVLDPYLDSINLTSPANYYKTTNQTSPFSFILNSNNWQTQRCDLSLRLNDSGSWTVHGTNSTTLNGVTTTIVASTISHGNYTWKISCNVTGDSESRWVFINDTKDPTVTASVSSITSSSATLGATIDEIATCTYSGDDEVGSGSLGTGTSLSTSLTGLEEDEPYEVTVTCNDTGGNTDSDTVDFTTDESSGGSSSSSSTTTTTAFWTSTYVADENEFKNETGYIKELSAKQRLRVVVNSVNHYIGVISLTSTTATINVSSDPQQAVLSVGDEKKFDVTGDDYYDVYVKLNSIASSKANLTLKEINEKMPETEPIQQTNETTMTANETTGEAEGAGEELEETEKTPLWFWVLVIIIILLIVGTAGFWYYYFYKKILKKKKPSSKRTIKKPVKTKFI
jgi:hypothetical protein